MLHTKRTQEALAKVIASDPALKPIVDNLVSTSGTSDIEFHNKFEAVMSILRDRGMNVDKLDPSDLETLVGVLMGAILSMQMELTNAKSNELDIPLNVNPFDENDIQHNMEAERCENAFRARLITMKGQSPRDRFSSIQYWKPLTQLDRWIQAKILVAHAAENEYRSLPLWNDLADSYGLFKE